MLFSGGTVIVLACVLHGPPEEAVAAMQVADGFRVELVASEPLITQPVCIEFDDRGRLWVIQYRQYPNPAGLTRAKVDRYSRTEYDRVPEPPPKGPRGADRITILTDTDGDGRADAAKDFLDGLNLATGLAFGHGGVFVLQVPYLLYYADRDRDDVPDSIQKTEERPRDGDPWASPEVLLTGFGMQDAHSVANSLTWGPDGWLYGCQGSTVTSNIRGIEFQQGVWRYHPLTHEFELFCEGGGNTWGLDFDRDGRLLYSTNYGDYVLVHGVQGAYYVKSFGKHGALHNPYSFGYFEHATHQGFRGGHVTAGGIVYQGDLFPPEFRGRYVAADLLGHGVYWHDITPSGSTVQTRHGGEFLVSRDSWFAPCDVTQGPEGAVYVADWHDARTAHPDPDAEWDRSNGRVFRISPSGAKPPAIINDITRKTSKELIELLGSTNSWQVRRARRVLADRRDPEVIFPLRTLVTTTTNPQLALEALWALYVSGGFDEEFAFHLLDHKNPRVREWTVRWLGDERRVIDSTADRLLDLASREPDLHVRSQLACTAKRLPGRVGLPLAQALLVRNLDAADPHLPLLCWWAIEQHAISELDSCRRLFATREAFQKPFVHTVIVPRLMRRWSAEGTPETLRACAELLANAPDDAERFALVTALEQGQRDGAPRAPASNVGTLFTAAAAVQQSETPAASERRIMFPEELTTQLRTLWTDSTTHVALIRLLAAQRDAKARERVQQILHDHSAPVPLRTELIAFAPHLMTAQDVVASLGPSLNTTEPEAIRLAAVDALSRFETDDVATVLFDSYGKAQGRVRDRLREAFFSRPAWALRFLDAVAAKQFPKTDVPVEQLRLLALHQDADLDARVRQLWGSVSRGTPEEKLAEMRRLSNDLRAAPGDVSRGQELFRKTCATCHQLATEGLKLGPDLTHANRQDREFLLASLVDPSAVVRAEFMNFVVITTQGRVATGLIAAQTPSEVTLVNVKNERTTFRRDEIDTLQESSTSFMPENLLKTLSPQELRDLFAYLQSVPGEKK